MSISSAITTSKAAAVLEPAGVHALDLGRAMDKVVSALSRKPTDTGAAYGVLVYAGSDQPEPNMLSATKAFVAAYMRARDALIHRASILVTHQDPDHVFSIEDDKSRHVRFFVGTAEPSVLKQRVKASPGVYILVGHLDAAMLDRAGLPPLPEQLRGLPLVMQVETIAETLKDRAKVFRTWLNPDKDLEVVHEDTQFEDAAARDSLEWRQQFMRAHECWSAAEVAAESTSTAKNRAAIASRWVREKKIFALKYEGQLCYPRFQFRDGEPVPAIAQVIREFPEHANGWDLAYFFASPNPNIDGRKPLDLLKSDPARVASLARAFAHPADVF
jgi:hypothetical protein